MNQISGGLFYNFNDATTDQNIFGKSLLRLSAESTNTQIYFAIPQSKLKMILSSRSNCCVHSNLVSSYSASRNQIEPGSVEFYYFGEILKEFILWIEFQNGIIQNNFTL